MKSGPLKSEPYKNSKKKKKMEKKFKGGKYFFFKISDVKKPCDLFHTALQSILHNVYLGPRKGFLNISLF